MQALNPMLNNRFVIVLALGLMLSAYKNNAQDLDLLNSITDTIVKKEPVFATFKTVRLGNIQTTECIKAQHLDFRILHRFGNFYNSDLAHPLNQSAQNLFGLNQVSDVRFSLDYGITSNLSLGIGHSSWNKLIDGALKWRLMQQYSGNARPLSAVLFFSAGYTHMPTQQLYSGVYKNFPTKEVHRFNYVAQLLLARKFNSWLSLELIPGMVHRNFIIETKNTANQSYDQNRVFTLGMGARVKIAPRVCIIADYTQLFSPFYYQNPERFMPLALGVEVETGGHVFSFICTNAAAIVENNLLTQTYDSWLKGQIKLGFCISRTFSFKRLDD